MAALVKAYGRLYRISHRAVNVLILNEKYAANKNFSVRMLKLERTPFMLKCFKMYFRYRGYVKELERQRIREQVETVGELVEPSGYGIVVTPLQFLPLPNG